jgi:hypothetical protein
MHRAIAAWLTERPWRAAFASAICGALSPQMLLPFLILAGAIPVLVLARYGASMALSVALAGAAAASWVVLSVYAPTIWLFVGLAWLFLGPVALRLILQRTGSMVLTFQVAILATGAGVLLIHVLLADPVAIWIPLLQPIVESMSAAGWQVEADQEAIVQVWARTMWGALGAISLVPLLGSLFLGRWWEALLRSPGAFGEEYRRLRIGMVLGSCITVLFALAVFLDSALLSSLAWVGFAGLVFQGLAAAHRSKAKGRLNKGWLAAIYVLLIVPLSTSLTVFVLGIWGFADNWLRPRTQSA